MKSSVREQVCKILPRPFWMPQPTKEEIVGEAVAELHEKLSTAREMGAPKGVPKDVWAKSYAVVGHYKAGEQYHRRWIASQLIMAARKEALEEAAKVAESFRSDNPYPTVYAAIAAAIRSLEGK